MTGFFDEEETAIVKKISENWSRNKGPNQMLNELFRLLQSFFYNFCTADVQLKQYVMHSPIVQAIKLSDQFMPILTPPPQA
ncbi:MAG: hypothetical protein ICV66_02805 [Chitinophagaceae bacterium]|nr:hypothetical protein [Chitinophagaceae bacterium]